MSINRAVTRQYGGPKRRNALQHKVITNRNILQKHKYFCGDNNRTEQLLKWPKPKHGKESTEEKIQIICAIISQLCRHMLAIRRFTATHHCICIPLMPPVHPFVLVSQLLLDLCYFIYLITGSKNLIPNSSRTDTYKQNKQTKCNHL